MLLHLLALFAVCSAQDKFNIQPGSRRPPWKPAGKLVNIVDARLHLQAEEDVANKLDLKKFEQLKDGSEEINLGALLKEKGSNASFNWFFGDHTTTTRRRTFAPVTTTITSTTPTPPTTHIHTPCPTLPSGQTRPPGFTCPYGPKSTSPGDDTWTGDGSRSPTGGGRTDPTPPAPPPDKNYVHIGDVDFPVWCIILLIVILILLIIILIQAVCLLFCCRDRKYEAATPATTPATTVTVTATSKGSPFSIGSDVKHDPPKPKRGSRVRKHSKATKRSTATSTPASTGASSTPASSTAKKKMRRQSRGKQERGKRAKRMPGKGKSGQLTIGSKVPRKPDDVDTLGASTKSVQSVREHMPGSFSDADGGGHFY